MSYWAYALAIEQKTTTVKRSVVRIVQHHSKSQRPPPVLVDWQAAGPYTNFR